MTPKEILDRVSQIADTRFDETIEKLMVTLRSRHCKGKWRRSCDCDFCQFLKGEYTDAKLDVHRMKRKIERFDMWDSESHINALRERLERMARLTETKKQFITQTTL